MLRRHAGSLLSAYHHRELPPEKSEWVAQHLKTCRRCASEYEEIRLGASLAALIPRVAAPDAVWRSLQSRLQEAPRTVRRFPSWGVRFRRPVVVATALLLCIAASTFWYLNLRHRAVLRPAGQNMTPLEAAALEAHRWLAAGTQQLALRGSGPQAVRDWVWRESRLDVHLSGSVGARDGERSYPVGAEVLTLDYGRAALVAYRLDGFPVTLLTAQVGVFPGDPAEGLLSKNIFFRRASGPNPTILTWSSSGQAYVLVSELPNYGLQSCLLCHTNESHGELIRTMTPL